MAYWESSGALMPRVITNTVHSGQYSMIIGLPTMPEIPGDGRVWQWVTIPSGVTAAPWRFWYNVYSRDGDPQYDWFEAGIFDPDLMQTTAILQSTGTAGWAHAEIDLTSYAGKTIALAFHVRQDGNAGATWALVDDTSLCVEPPAIPAPAPFATGTEGTCFAEGGLFDYAPSGMPDFEMIRTGGWSATSQAWVRDAPAAAANALWWLDSVNEPGSNPPPAVSDGFNLVESYDGIHDDHATTNVPDLIGDLANRFSTGDAGTALNNAVQGLRNYLNARGMGSQFSVTSVRAPSYATLQSAVADAKGVILLLGFWEWQGKEWKRLGGHYVTVAGAGCADGPRALAISDPWRDWAEKGRDGEVLPAQRHTHSGSHEQTLHDNAAVLSHDVYQVGTMDNAAMLVGYARYLSDVENFLGLNFAVEQGQPALHRGGPIYTRIDYAIIIAPAGAAETAVSESAPTAQIHGVVEHEAWPTPPPVFNIPLLVSLHEPTSPYPLYLWSITTTNVTEFTTPLFEPGEYTIKAQSARSLRNAAVAFDYPAGTTQVDMETLLTGDLNNDNRVDGLDVSLMAGRIASGTYEPLPDLNMDNAVNGLDQALMWANFGKAGDIVVLGIGLQSSVAGSAPQIAGSSAVTGAFLNLAPSALRVYQGQVFFLDVTAQLPSDSADTVEFHLDFDPGILQVVDSRGRPATQIQSGDAMPLVAYNRADNGIGRIDFCATTTEPGGKAGTFTVAKIHFKAVAQSRGAWVRFTRDQWPYTEVAYQGKALLRRYAGAEITVGAAPVGRNFLPVVMR